MARNISRCEGEDTRTEVLSGFVTIVCDCGSALVPAYGELHFSALQSLREARSISRSAKTVVQRVGASQEVKILAQELQSYLWGFVSGVCDRKSALFAV